MLFRKKMLYEYGVKLDEIMTLKSKEGDVEI